LRLVSKYPLECSFGIAFETGDAPFTGNPITVHFAFATLPLSCSRSDFGGGAFAIELNASGSRKWKHLGPAWYGHQFVRGRELVSVMGGFYYRRNEWRPRAAIPCFRRVERPRIHFGFGAVLADPF
jgi:hypothetical protein